MEDLHYAIVSEEMVWLWYYDDFGGKHIKELLAKEAKEFIGKLPVSAIDKDLFPAQATGKVTVGTDMQSKK